MDERFRGWGHEDVAFTCAAKVLYGMPAITKGFSYHLWHPRLGRSGRDRWSGQDSPYTNLELVRPYQAANTPEKMRAVIASRG